MAFHHQPDQAFALLVSLGQELLGCRQDGLPVGLHFDLRDSLDSHRYALFGVQILLRRHVERHQFQRKVPANLHHRKHQRAMPLHNPRPAESIHDECFVGSSFAIEPGQHAGQEQNGHHSQPGDNTNLQCP